MQPDVPNDDLQKRALGPRYVVELQALRGLAALVVLLHHCIFFFIFPADIRSFIEIVLNSHAAVVLFFVLSGYVLALSAPDGSTGPSGFVRFLVRRLFRLFPAIWGASVFVLLLLAFFDLGTGVPERSAWAQAYYRASQIHGATIVLAFLALSPLLIPPIWSIMAELIGSVVVFLLLALRSASLWLALCFTLGLGIWSLSLPGTGYVNVLTSYMVHFAIGAMLAGLPTNWANGLQGRWVTALALLSLVTMMAFRQLGDWSFERHYHAPWPGLVEGIAAAALIILIAARPDRFGWLRWSPLVELGNISYSLYLVHFPIMVLLAIFLAGPLGLTQSMPWPLPSLILMLLTTLASLVVAKVFFRWIEIPGIAAGKRMDQYLKTSPFLQRWR